MNYEQMDALLEAQDARGDYTFATRLLILQECKSCFGYEKSKKWVYDLAEVVFDEWYKADDMNPFEFINECWKTYQCAKICHNEQQYDDQSLLVEDTRESFYYA